MNEHEQLKQQLADAEAELAILRLVVNTLPDHIYAKDTQSRHTFVNKAKVVYYGVKTHHELLGKTDLDLHPEFGELYMAAEQAMLRSGKPIINLEEPLEHTDGSQGWVLTTKIPFYDEEGSVQGFVGIGRDITDLKAAQQQQRDQQLIIDAQRDTLRQLASPVIPIWERIIILPLIGEIDGVRSRDMMRALLEGITRYRALVVIMDLTGVPVVDTSVAQSLARSIQAARLKGTLTIITGITDAVAETLVDLGADLGALEIATDLMEGLKKAFQKRGIGIREAPSESGQDRRGQKHS